MRLYDSFFYNHEVSKTAGSPYTPAELSGQASLPGASWSMGKSDKTSVTDQAAARGLAEATTPFVPAVAPPLADQVALATSPPAPLVAIGTSAGGLEALEQFFAAVEVPTGFAFVIVQHLSPDLQSLMVELLAKCTALAVRAVENGTAPVADAIHLVPPGQMVILADIPQVACRMTARSPDLGR